MRPAQRISKTRTTSIRECSARPERTSPAASLLPLLASMSSRLGCPVRPRRGKGARLNKVTSNSASRSVTGGVDGCNRVACRLEHKAAVLLAMKEGEEKIEKYPTTEELCRQVNMGARHVDEQEGLDIGPSAARPAGLTDTRLRLQQGVGAGFGRLVQNRRFATALPTSPS